MSAEEQILRYEDEFLDITKFFNNLWQGRIWIVIGVTVTTLIAIVYVLLVTPTYRVSVLLEPVSQSDNKTASALSKNLGGLSSFVNLGSAGDKTAANLATLTSLQFLTAFIRQQKMMSELYPELNAAGSEKSSNKRPDIYDAAEKFRKKIEIANDKKTGLVTINFEWQNSKQSADWLNELIYAANSYLREDAIRESQDSINYLQKVIAETQEIEIRELIYHLLSSEIQNMKVAKIRSDYAFKVIDPAIVPKKPFKPNKILIVIIGFLFGGLLSVIAVLAKNFFNTLEKPANQ